MIVRMGRFGVNRSLPSFTSSRFILNPRYGFFSGRLPSVYMGQEKSVMGTLDQAV